MGDHVYSQIVLKSAQTPQAGANQAARGLLGRQLEQILRHDLLVDSFIRQAIIHELCDHPSAFVVGTFIIYILFPPVYISSPATLGLVVLESFLSMLL